MSEPFIIRPEDRPHVDLGHSRVEVLATSLQTAGAFTLMQTHTEPGGGPPLHLHRDAAEAFYVLEGAFMMYVDDHQTLCRAGAFVYVPRGTPHTFEVVSDTPGKKLNLFSPAAMTDYFMELATLREAGPVTPEQQREIAARWDMQILGPLPTETVDRRPHRFQDG